MPSPDLSISIVNFNTRELTLRCLESVFAHSGSLQIEVIVVDNASTDGSAEAIRSGYPQVKLITNTENRLFVGGHNQAFAIARGEFFLLLNSDITIDDEILSQMVRYLKENPSCGGTGSAMYFPDGKLQRNCSDDFSLELAFLSFTLYGKVFRKRIQALQEQTFYGNWDRLSSRPVGVIPDSFLMVRRSILPKDKPLYEPRLGLYFTENDLCLQIRQKGYSTYYLAQGKVVHQERGSVDRAPIDFIAKIYRNDIAVYFSKHEGWFKTALLMLAIFLSRHIALFFHKTGIKQFKKNLVWGIAG